MPQLATLKAKLVSSIDKGRQVARFFQPVFQMPPGVFQKHCKFSKTQPLLPLRDTLSRVLGHPASNQRTVTSRLSSRGKAEDRRDAESLGGDGQGVRPFESFFPFAST